MKYLSNIIIHFRYVADMGHLRLRTIVNTGIRKEPATDSRVTEYKDFLNTGGVLIGRERIIVDVKGGGLALLTSLPEVLDKKCQRMGLKTKGEMSQLW